MAVRDDRSDVKQTTTGFRDPRHHICQKQIPIPPLSLFVNKILHALFQKNTFALSSGDNEAWGIYELSGEYYV